MRGGPSLLSRPVTHYLLAYLQLMIQLVDIQKLEDLFTFKLSFNLVVLVMEHKCA